MCAEPLCFTTPTWLLPTPMNKSPQPPTTSLQAVMMDDMPLGSSVSLSASVYPLACAVSHILTFFTLQDLQLQNSDLRKQMRESPSVVSSSASSAPASATTHPLVEFKKDFDTLGRQFCTFHEIWVRPPHLRKPYPEGLRQTGPLDPSHYRNDQSKQDGVIAELYDFVPSRFHAHLERSPYFAKTVSAILVPSITSHSFSYSSYPGPNL